jgi:hypothetical protein
MVSASNPDAGDLLQPPFRNHLVEGLCEQKKALGGSGIRARLVRIVAREHEPLANLDEQLGHGRGIQPSGCRFERARSLCGWWSVHPRLRSWPSVTCSFEPLPRRGTFGRKADYLCNSCAWSFAMPARKRELIETGTDKRYVRRDETGRFDEVVDVGRSLSQDRKRSAKTVAKPGHGDKGDRKPRSK